MPAINSLYKLRIVLGILLALVRHPEIAQSVICTRNRDLIPTPYKADYLLIRSGPSERIILGHLIVCRTFGYLVQDDLSHSGKLPVTHIDY